MNSRTKRYLRLLALIGLATCRPTDEPPPVGEFPVHIATFGTDGFLVTSYFDPDHRGRAEARLFHFNAGSSVEPVEHLDLSVDASGFSRMAAMVTVNAGIPIVYGWAANRPFRFGDGNPIVADFQAPFGSCGTSIPENGDSVLRLFQRDSDRQWLFTAACSFVGRWLPGALVAYEGPKISLVRSDVVWADCSGQWCRQLRFDYDQTTLRLYASPITGDLFKPITEATVASLADYFEPHRYVSCKTKKHGDLVAIDDEVFALSATQPAMDVITGSTEALITDIETECPSPVLTIPVGSRGNAPLVAEFSSGEAVWAYQYYDRSPDVPDCAWDQELIYGGCLTDYDLYETRIVLFDKSGEKTKSFPVHDL